MGRISEDEDSNQPVFRVGKRPQLAGSKSIPAGSASVQSPLDELVGDVDSGAMAGPGGSGAATGSSTDLVETIDDVTLPEPIATLVDDYADVFGERDRFLWRWIYALLPEFTLSCVADEHAESVRIRKTILTMFVTLLDDLAEKRGDARTFDEIRRSIRWSGAGRADRPGVDAEVFSLAERIWTAFEANLEAAPCHDQYREVFDYDLRQSMSAMEYSRLVNDRLSMANPAGVEHYGPHNMIMFPYADLDLMHSPGFDPAEFGAVRELVWDLQRLARIGNSVSTWERELREGDYTSAVVVRALRRGVVSVEDLESSDPERRAAAASEIKEAGIEARFVQEWQRLYRSVCDHGIEAESVDLDAFVAGMETVVAYQMAGRGHK